jgi:photosystem II stability/assembly factor-like uncharacterized protein
MVLTASLALCGCFDFSSLQPTGADASAVADGAIALSWTNRSGATGQTLRAVGGRGSDVWAVGDKGTILYSSDHGADWVTQVACTSATLRAVAAVGNNIYVGGDGGALCRTDSRGNSWLTVTPTGVPIATIQGIAALGSTVVLAEGEGNIVTFTDGMSDYTHPIGPAAGWVYFAVWADAGEIWAVGSAPGDADAGSPVHGIYRHYSAGAWGTHYSNPIGPFLSVWSDGGGSNVWLGTDADNAVFSHDDGTTWKRYTPSWPVAEPYLWGAGEDDIWAVGDPEILYHKDASGWSSVPNPSHKALWAIWGTASDDIYCVGQGGTILHHP